MCVYVCTHAHVCVYIYVYIKDLSLFISHRDELHGLELSWGSRQTATNSPGPN